MSAMLIINILAMMMKDSYNLTRALNSIVQKGGIQYNLSIILPENCNSIKAPNDFSGCFVILKILVFFA